MSPTTSCSPLRVLSLGAGVQSTTMALMAAHGEFGPMPDCAIFADTGWEPKAVYEQLSWLQSGNILPFPIHVVEAGHIRNNIISACNHEGDRFVSIPFFTMETKPAGSEIPVYDEDDEGELVQVGSRTLTKDEHHNGIGRRQCTNEFKIEPIAKKQRELLGFKKYQRIPAGSVEVWIGISLDEAMRVKPSRNAWQVNRWPLIEKRMSRQDCLTWLIRHDYPVPPKSSCIGCPFHSNAHWREMRDHDPEAWVDAIRIDHALRANGLMRGMRSELFMHRSNVPLDQVDLSTAEDHGQLNLFINECEGICGV